MKNKFSQKTLRTIQVASLLGALLLLSIAFTVYSEVSDFVINWWSVDGGGDSSQGGNYTLNGTIGQSDTGATSGGGYTLHGGFWPGGALLQLFKFYLPTVMR